TGMKKAARDRPRWTRFYELQRLRDRERGISRMSMLNDILRNAVTAKASDIHINVGMPPLFRIHTIVTPSDFPMVTPEGSMRLCKEIMQNNEKRWAAFEELRDSDFSYEIPGIGRFRVNAHYQRNTVALSIRTINDKVRPIEQLFLPEIVMKLTH